MNKHKSLQISLTAKQSNVFCEAAEFFYDALSVISQDKAVIQRRKALEEIEVLFNDALVEQGILTEEQVQEQSGKLSEGLPLQ